MIEGFKLLERVMLEELNAEGLWLKHERTGLEVFHIVCDDAENLFSFAFKTPSFNSTGVAHIIEHSVLCGSERYPLRDPFIKLANQSVNTFLNALTSSTRTMYPASTMIEADYFNLMSVYADAVFFPRLEEWTFKQEGHRVEIDENGELSIQGVVYNEMKGAYSSFDSVAGDWSEKVVLQGTVFAEDSGGEPKCIPNLTYEQFKEFHRVHYAPSNCKLFLYGNIPTQKQLAFIEQNFLSRFSDEDLSRQNALCTDEDFVKKAFGIGVPQKIKEPKTITVCAPASEDVTGPTVLVNWRYPVLHDPLVNAEFSIIDELILGNRSSPLHKALLDSGLGEDISPVSGSSGEEFAVFSVGLRGVKGDVNVASKKIEKLILDTLDDLYKNGIENIESAFMALEISQKEIKRSENGPYSLVHMRRAYRYWMHGGKPYDFLIPAKYVAIIKQNIQNDQDYLSSLIKKFFIDNKERMTLIVEPDAQFDAKQKQEEQNHIQKLFANAKDKAQKDALLSQIKLEQEKLHALQQQSEDEKASALLPHLRPKDLTPIVIYSNEKRSNILDVPFVACEEATNSITYLSVRFPIDVLEPADYRFLTLLEGAITMIGFGGMDWSDAETAVTKCCSGLFANLCVDRPARETATIDKSCTNDALFDRFWLDFSCKMLEEKTQETVDLLFSCIFTGDFTDTKRLSQILDEYHNNLQSAVIPDGHRFAARRTKRKSDKYGAVTEILYGISQLYTVLDLCDMPIEELANELKRIRDVIIASGCFVAVTGTKEGIKSVQDAIKTHVQKHNLQAPSNPFEYNLRDFTLMTELENEEDEILSEAFTSGAQIGYAVLTLPCVFGNFSRSASAQVLCHYLSHTLLWEQIRTIGGAYGAFAQYNMYGEQVSFVTFRDPRPDQSLQAFRLCLEKMATEKLDNDALEQAITGTFGRELQPVTPAEKGIIGLNRLLSHITEEPSRKKKEAILCVTSDDVQNCAKELLLNFDKAVSAIILPKTINYTGKTINLPL